MADNQLGMIGGHASAATRLADALLRSFGNSQITLRLADPSSGDTQSQLGLEAPPGEDLQISPAVVKPLAPTADGKRRIEVVIGASSLKAIAKDYGVEDIVPWLLSFEGVLQGDQLMRIVAVTADRFLGADCLYRLTATE